MADETLALVAHNIFLWTMRIGGVALAVVTLWSWVGQVMALLLDAVVSVPTGVALILTAILFTAGGGVGLIVILYAVFGALFVSSGVRNWRDYRVLSGTGEAGRFAARSEYDPNFARSYEQVKSEPAGPSLASQLRERTQQAAAKEAEPTPIEASAQSRPVEAADAANGAGAEQSFQPIPAEPPSQSPPVVPQKEQIGASDPYEAPAPAGEDDDGEPPDGFLAGFADDGPPRQP